MIMMYVYRYTLNLTSITGYHMEYETYNFFYYTPCSNDEICHQGNAEFYANAVEYKPGENECLHYLSIDHHERPEYSVNAASWGFKYSDGEFCDEIQQPRDLNVIYQCDENFISGAYISDVYEYDICRYIMEIRTPLACIRENQYNANCQWKHIDSNNNTWRLDLYINRKR